MTAVLVATCTTTRSTRLLGHAIGDTSCGLGGSSARASGLGGDAEALMLRIPPNHEGLAAPSPGPAAMSQTRGRGKAAVTSKLPSSAVKEHIPGRNGVNGSTVKRKAIDYDENIEGFQFTRAGLTKKSKQTNGATLHGLSEGSSTPEPSAATSTLRTKKKRLTAQKQVINDTIGPSLESIDGKPTRTKSKRTLVEKSAESSSPKQPNPRKAIPVPDLAPIHVAKKRKPAKTKVQESTVPPQRQREEDAEHDPIHNLASPEDARDAGTKIALPFADTPVIQRNKDMRKEKSRKGQRRSSLSLRGRRASSLIDSGASNALPHDKVDTAHFYKHIASEGLPEPRRMRQLLTWCATRALGEKPTGSRSEDESARLAARVIQEEMLKDMGDRSDLSDWFSRPESSSPAIVIKKPNPRNIQNEDKIKELEEHIRRLQAERQSLAALLRPPSIPSIKPVSVTLEQTKATPGNAETPLPDISSINPSLLDSPQRSILNSLQAPHPKPKESHSDPSESGPDLDTSISSISERLTRLSASLAPTLDSFAAGIHDIELFRQSADNFSSHVLRLCAQRLEERDIIQNQTGDQQLEEKEEGGNYLKGSLDTRREDLSEILKALSRLERR